jgi:2-polyprenyl-3-methyl-5-hydroxy-6-metoxy-1,4-benzoquinol methylase
MGAGRGLRRICALCAAEDSELLHVYDAPPVGETDFGFHPYQRELRRCRACGVYFNAHQLDLSRLYSEDYNRAKYADKLLRTFQKIMALPPQASDNHGRVERVLDWLARSGRVASEMEILDVGSGLAVFAAGLARRGLACHCIDPSPLSAAHALEHAGAASARTGSIGDWPLSHPLDLITWNKVLEHVPDPVALLRESARRLAPGGAVYIELPDGEAALREGGPGRQEFFIEHVTAWSLPALGGLVQRAGLTLLESGALRDPSGKFTLFGFAG